MFSFFSFLFLFFLYITLQNTISKQINKKNYIKITNNNWNLQGTPSASWNSVQQDFWAREQWRRVFPRATVTGGASSHAPPSLAARLPKRHRKQLETAGSGSPCSPLPFPAGGDHHCHLQKEGKRKQSFGSSSPFRSALLSSPFGFLLFPSAGGGRL